MCERALQMPEKKLKAEDPTGHPDVFSFRKCPLGSTSKSTQRADDSKPISCVNV